MARAGPGEGVAWRAASSLAGVLGPAGLARGGNGCGLRVPLSCARAAPGTNNKTAQKTNARCICDICDIPALQHTKAKLRSDRFTFHIVAGTTGPGGAGGTGSKGEMRCAFPQLLQAVPLSSPPDRCGDLHHAAQLGFLIGNRQRIAEEVAAEAALR